MRISERCALLERVGRSAQHRCQLRGALPCMPYHALSSGSGRFDSLRVHRATNDRTRMTTASPRSVARVSLTPRGRSSSVREGRLKRRILAVRFGRPARPPPGASRAPIQGVRRVTISGRRRRGRRGHPAAPQPRSGSAASKRE
jgi:hypothetical protein